MVGRHYAVWLAVPPALTSHVGHMVGRTLWLTICTTNHVCLPYPSPTLYFMPAVTLPLALQHALQITIR